MFDTHDLWRVPVLLLCATRPKLAPRARKYLATVFLSWALMADAREVLQQVDDGRNLGLSRFRDTQEQSHD